MAQEMPTLTVMGFGTAMTPEGQVALVMSTVEEGPIAFEVTEEAIVSLRVALASAETLLRQKPGRA
jgi:hypothetical protein